MVLYASHKKVGLYSQNFSKGNICTGMSFFRFNTEIRFFSAKYMVIEIDPDPVRSLRAILREGGGCY